MAQLSDDCFAFGGNLRRLDAALDDLAGRLTPVVQAETVGLANALGRVLATDAVSGLSVPSFDNSAVDGYAVCFSDLASERETKMLVGARVPAGARKIAPIRQGEAVRIFTGAPMPPGADTVFMQEDVRLEGDTVLLPPGLKEGANRRFLGEDFTAGEVLVRTGTRLRAHHIAALAATGVRDVAVFRPLRVAVFSTGDELVDAADHIPGISLPLGVQIDSNRPMLNGLLAARGISVLDLGIVPDRRDVIAAALTRAASECDAILTSGGVSTGEEDHVKAAVEKSGKLDFWRLAIKPGRPIAMGTIAGKSFLGMPGNPAAVFVTFTRFVGPVLDLLAGATPNRPAALPVISGFRYRKKSERREYVRVRLEVIEGRLVAQRFEKDGAALISSLIASDGLVELDEDRLSVEPGESLPFLSFPALLV
ncbi:MAG: molybdopterin molybdenumtransferase MoeA [Rhizobiales bacterium PAR1]|nr:MAG: molybdopterin molybdenumtransferase MoeA [Rhizobiales bacterium PAR1]